MNKVDGRRISAAEAYLTAEVRARENFTLRPECLVRRIVFENRRAVGVEIESARGVERIDGSSVVLCGGAINTPSILLRSGVGPRAEVERIGCELVADVPAIGARLLDHPGCAIFLRPRFRAPTNRKDPLLQTVLRYASGSGHVSDMQLQPGSKLTLWERDLPLVSLMCSIGKPRGTGALHWDSADPHARPIIHSRVLDDNSDRALAVDAMQLAFRVAQQKPIAELATPLWPSARVLRDRQRVDAWIRFSSDSGYHPSGTVPFGPRGKSDAAADGCGRVYGVEGVVVGDASLMPTIPCGNIHLPVLMIGERIGEILRDAA